MINNEIQKVIDLSVELEGRGYTGNDIISKLRTIGFEDYEIKAGLKELGYTVTTAHEKIIIVSAPLPQKYIPDFDCSPILK
ncbi:MAG: hypothetical protein U9M94_04200 [Patescibacteria group bacterium]|nr:hypothetical protein [Patescibacteria group bacterium]